MTASADRANVGQDVIKLTPEQASKFDTAVFRRQAIMEAGETMARNFATQMDEAMQGLQGAYEEAAKAYDLDLSKSRYDYDPNSKSLILTQVAVRGTLR